MFLEIESVYNTVYAYLHAAAFSPLEARLVKTNRRSLSVLEAYTNPRKIRHKAGE